MSMLDIKNKDGKLKARIGVQTNIDDFDYSLSIYFVEGNQEVFLKLNRFELSELSRKIEYLLIDTMGR